MSVRVASRNSTQSTGKWMWALTQVQSRKAASRSATRRAARRGLVPAFPQQLLDERTHLIFRQPGFVAVQGAFAGHGYLSIRLRPQNRCKRGLSARRTASLR